MLPASRENSDRPSELNAILLSSRRYTFSDAAPRSLLYIKGEADVSAGVLSRYCAQRDAAPCLVSPEGIGERCRAAVTPEEHQRCTFAARYRNQVAVAKRCSGAFFVFLPRYAATVAWNLWLTCC